MDPSKEHGPQSKATGTSRLPQMIASPTKGGSVRSNLPRISSRYGASKIVPPVPLGESLNRSIASKINASGQSARIRSPSPVRDALQAAQAAALDTTTPSSTGDAPVFTDNDENPVQPEKSPQKRKPRPSLTERTLETLAQISSSPSPTRRRASVSSSISQMGPPLRPASSARSSRPNTPSTVRSVSPVRQPFRPPGRNSPTKEGPSAAVPSPGSLFSPPKAFVKGGSLRFLKPSNEQKSTSTSIPSLSASKGPAKYTAKTMRAKPSSHETAHTSLENMFKDPVKSAAPPSNRLAVGSSPNNSGLLKPRSIGENTIATSPSSVKAERNKANSSKPLSAGSETAQQIPQPTLKSSAALRETISRAKAAKKSAISSVDTSIQPGGASLPVTQTYDEDLDIIGTNEGLLGQRLRGATASGTLNISAMKLNLFPDAVMTMYDSNEHSINWAEMVDLKRLNAADNMLVTISDKVFPDWWFAELEEDEEKTNQFGGLENLDLHNNLLQTIPIGLRRLAGLTSLNLSGNKLNNSALEVIHQIPNLQILNVSRNQLSGSIHLGGSIMQNMRTLNLAENRIETLEIAEGGLSISIFDLSSNRLRSLPWQGLAKVPIISLNVSANRLEGAAFDGVGEGFDQLKELDLSNNALGSLAPYASELSALQTCRMNNNKISKLPNLSRWQCLMTLQISENQLTEIPAGLTELHNLRNVDFSNNSMKSLDVNLAMMESLVSLVIVGNPLRDRKFLTMDTDELKCELQKRLGPDPDAGVTTNSSQFDGFSTSVPALGSASFFRYKPVSGTLDLASKSLGAIDIEQIDFGSASAPIHTLRLSNNDLTALPFELLSHPALKWSLRSLDISHNPHLHPIDYLVEDLFLPELKSLYVVSTGLTSLDGVTNHLKAPALTELNISCHRLEGHVPWIRAWFPNCTSLLASDNWFSSIDVEAARGLEVLDIRNNYIEALPRGIGLLGNHAGKTEAGKLRVFECGGNKFRSPRITVIEKGTEAVLKDLRRMVPEAEVPEEWKDEI